MQPKVTVVALAPPSTRETVQLTAPNALLATRTLKHARTSTLKHTRTSTHASSNKPASVLGKCQLANRAQPGQCFQGKRVSRVPRPAQTIHQHVATNNTTAQRRCPKGHTFVRVFETDSFRGCTILASNTTTGVTGRELRATDQGMRVAV